MWPYMSKAIDLMADNTIDSSLERFGQTDATILALAKERGIRKVLTLDQEMHTVLYKRK